MTWHVKLRLSPRSEMNELKCILFHCITSRMFHDLSKAVDCVHGWLAAGDPWYFQPVQPAKMTLVVERRWIQLKQRLELLG